jgi:hypothetical protein
VGIPELTLKTVRKQTEVKEGCKSAMRMAVSTMTKIWVVIMRKLGRMLAQ